MVRPFRPPLLSDERIQRLLQESKQAPKDWRSKLSARKVQARHRRAEVALDSSDTEGTFLVFVREHVEHPLNFTAGLRYRTREGHSYRLVRCNGLHPGGHVNHLEGERFGTSFHVHRATARYQEAGYEIDGYAEQSDAFRTLPQAISHLAGLASILAPPGETEPML